MTKYRPEVYAAMRQGGLSNRRIGELLGVDEASVRRGLNKYTLVTRTPMSYERTVRDVLNELADVIERDRRRT